MFQSEQTYWLADGFHRVQAAKDVEITRLSADVREGTRRDALLFACGANDAHGIRRTAEDKRRAVLTLLEDAEWAKWSDNEIARRCKVSDHFVNKCRSFHTSIDRSMEPEQRIFIHHKTGKPTTMNVANIGKANSVKSPLTWIDPSEKSVEASEEDSPPLRPPKTRLTDQERAAFISFLSNFHQMFGNTSPSLTDQNLTWLTQNLEKLQKVKQLLVTVNIRLHEQLKQLPKILEAGKDPDVEFFREEVLF